MDNFLVFSLILSVIACSAADDNADYYDENRLEKRRDDGNTDFNPEEVDAIVARHNYHRANTKPSATNMREMKWDSDLATMAQKWANTCNYKHGGMSGPSSFRAVGQNLAIGSLEVSKDGARVTDMWHSEEDFYTYETTKCLPGKMCGHYTQVIWAGTYAIGCGRKLCSSAWVKGRMFRNAYYVVCDYGPAGNYQGEKPFLKGEPCLTCPNDAGFCSENNLCVDCTSASDKASCGECTRTCENCGTLDKETCTCQCAPGWDGPTCSDPCGDNHDMCGRSPGWWGPPMCLDSYWPMAGQVRQFCRIMCSMCEPKDPSFVCNA